MCLDDLFLTFHVLSSGAPAFGAKDLAVAFGVVVGFGVAFVAAISKSNTNSKSNRKVPRPKQGLRMTRFESHDIRFEGHDVATAEIK